MTTHDIPRTIPQLRGQSGAESALNVAHLNLGLLSAHAMGTLMKGNLLISSLQLDHNPFGASGIKAIIQGLGEAPVKSLHIKSAGLAGTDDVSLTDLTGAICRSLGQVRAR